MKKVIYGIGAVGVVISILVFVQLNALRSPQSTNTPQQEEQSRPTSKNFTYGGQNGRDALTLLKEKTTVEQDAAGLVVSINGVKADSEKKEFWSFYVNGTMAPVGPAEYQTKDRDHIEWRMETY